MKISNSDWDCFEDCATMNRCDRGVTVARIMEHCEMPLTLSCLMQAGSLEP